MATLPFRGRLILRIIPVTGTISGGLFFGSFAEAFGFELENLGPGPIEFGLQFRVSLNHARMPAFPIADVASQLADLPTKFGVLAPQLTDFQKGVIRSVP